MIRNPLASVALLVASLGSTAAGEGFRVRLGADGAERLIDTTGARGGLLQIIDTDPAKVAAETRPRRPLDFA